MGDTGEGNMDQYMVSSVIETVCLQQGCDFGLLLGDNFYNEGVDGIDDPQWQTKFEDVYANLDIQFYPALGNHDGGIFGAGVQLGPGNIQVDYSTVSDKWNMPGRYYLHTHGAVDMIAIDTSSIFFNGLFSWFSDLTDDQQSFLATTYANSQATWRIAYGHHPYYSNGEHGNAGTYEGFDFIPLANGTKIQEFIEGYVCGNVDFYLAGHDHNRQWITTDCQGTQFIVAGAGAKTTEFRVDDGNHPTDFADDTTEGFVWFEAAGNTLTVEFWDKFGNMNHTGTITK